MARHEGGFAVLATLLIAVVAATSAALAIYSPRAGSVFIDDQRTNDALSAARLALIGYAVSRGGLTGTARPGELPCPDTNNDGLEETNCAAGAVGRLPWRTLGIPDPKDSAGETLWYAVAGPFRTRPSNGAQINSDTVGNITVRAADGATATTTQAAAVIFAPGTALNGQRRTVQAEACATTGTTIAAVNCAVNYLESTAGFNNAVNNGPYVAGQPAQRFNDRLAYVTANDILPVVEVRVGNELRNLLLAYRARSACRCYPWADSWAYSGGIADVGLNRGRFPSRPYPENWGEGSIPRLPEWIAANDWHNRVWYSAARQETAGAGAGCVFCSAANTLTVDSIPVSALLFMPGPAPAGVSRTAGGNINNLTLYLDDPENNDGASCPGTNQENANAIPNILAPLISLHCDRYTRPSSRAMTRDRLFSIASTPGSLCGTAAAALVLNAPCHTTGNNVSAVCQHAANLLSVCSCSPAATTLVTPPCRNTLNPDACQTAVTQLQMCNI